MKPLIIAAMYLMFSQVAVSDTIKWRMLSGSYDYDLKGSELSKGYLKDLKKDVHRSAAKGLENLDHELVYWLGVMGIVEGGKFIPSDQWDEIIFSNIYSEKIDTGDESSIAKLFIDENGKFKFVNKQINGSDWPRICLIDKINEYGGVRCQRDGYDDELGIIFVENLDSPKIRVTISIDNGISQSFLKGH